MNVWIGSRRHEYYGTEGQWGELAVLRQIGKFDLFRRDKRRAAKSGLLQAGNGIKYAVQVLRGN